MLTGLGDAEEGELCMAKIHDRFNNRRGSISGIRGGLLIHFTRKWSGSHISLVSTMHQVFFRQAQGQQRSKDAQPPLKRRCEWEKGKGFEKPW